MLVGVVAAAGQPRVVLEGQATVQMLALVLTTPVASRTAAPSEVEKLVKRTQTSPCRGLWGQGRPPFRAAPPQHFHPSLLMTCLQPLGRQTQRTWLGRVGQRHPGPGQAHRCCPATTQD